MPFSTPPEKAATTTYVPPHARSSGIAKPKRSMAFDAALSVPRHSTGFSENATKGNNTDVPEFRRGARGTSENEVYSTKPIHPRPNTSLILVDKPRGRDNFHSGQIIFAMYSCTPWSDEPLRIDEDLTNLSRTKYGWIHSKMRPMIVLTTHARHMVVIPLRSFNGQGVNHLNDTPDVKKEYIPVKSEGQISDIDLEGQDYLKVIRPFDKDTAGCICMTEVHSIDYRTPYSIVEPANKLTLHSTRALLSAYKKFLVQSIDEGLVKANQNE